MLIVTTARVVTPSNHVRDEEESCYSSQSLHLLENTICLDQVLCYKKTVLSEKGNNQMKLNWKS